MKLQNDRYIEAELLMPWAKTGSEFVNLLNKQTKSTHRFEFGPLQIE